MLWKMITQCVCIFDLLGLSHDETLSFIIKEIMSIYSGFPTRKDETLYNRLLEKLIETLQNQLL